MLGSLLDMDGMTATLGPLWNLEVGPSPNAPNAER